jgi:hypothetical protein
VKTPGPRKPPTKFASAVKAAPKPVASALLAGKQALLKEHRAKVTCGDEARWTGSIEIDEALKRAPEHASANRWDYGLGYENPAGKESALWIEVHSAHTSEVSTVISKLRWLKAYLQASCPDLWRLTQATPEEQRFVWIASGKYAILPNSPQMRALRSAGLEKPAQKLVLP